MNSDRKEMSGRTWVGSMRILNEMRECTPSISPSVGDAPHIVTPFAGHPGVRTDISGRGQHERTGQKEPIVVVVYVTSKAGAYSGATLSWPISSEDVHRNTWRSPRWVWSVSFVVGLRLFEEVYIEHQSVCAESESESTIDVRRRGLWVKRWKRF